MPPLPSAHFLKSPSPRWAVCPVSGSTAGSSSPHPERRSRGLREPACAAFSVAFADRARSGAGGGLVGRAGFQELDGRARERVSGLHARSCIKQDSLASPRGSSLPCRWAGRAPGLPHRCADGALPEPARGLLAVGGPVELPVPRPHHLPLPGDRRGAGQPAGRDDAVPRQRKQEGHLALHQRHGRRGRAHACPARHDAPRQVGRVHRRLRGLYGHDGVPFGHGAEGQALLSPEHARDAPPPVGGGAGPGVGHPPGVARAAAAAGLHHGAPGHADGQRLREDQVRHLPQPLHVGGGREGLRGH